MQREDLLIKLHGDFGGITIGLFIGSLITFNVVIAYVALIAFILCICLGISIKGLGKEGKRTLRKCLPPTITPFLLWLFYIYSIQSLSNATLSYAIGVSSAALFSLYQLKSNLRT